MANPALTLSPASPQTIVVMEPPHDTPHTPMFAVSVSGSERRRSSPFIALSIPSKMTLLVVSGFIR